MTILKEISALASNLDGETLDFQKKSHAMRIFSVF
jgi:hypothetical protein